MLRRFKKQGLKMRVLAVLLAGTTVLFTTSLSAQKAQMRVFRIIVLGSIFMLLILYWQTGEVEAQGQFCATYNDDSTPEDCSFLTLGMCEQSVSGVGGSCAPQSLAPPMPPPPLIQFRPDPYAFAPAPMPPAPTGNQPVLPPPRLLPDASPDGN